MMKSVPHRPILQQQIVFWSGAFLSFLIMAALFPGYILGDKTSLMSPSLDRGFVLAFAFINDWLNGGIQLWNRFNQSPYAFTHLQTGFYDLHKFVSALYFSVFPPGASVGSDFRTPLIIIYFLFSIFIQTLGTYLLVRRFATNKAILIMTIVYSNTLLAVNYEVNLTTGNILTLVPLLVHLLLEFLENRRLVDAAWLLLVLSVAFVVNPYHLLNYVYLAIHFFLLVFVMDSFLSSSYGNSFTAGMTQVWRVWAGHVNGLCSWSGARKVFQGTRLSWMVMDVFAIGAVLGVVWGGVALYKHQDLSFTAIMGKWGMAAPIFIGSYLFVSFVLGHYHRESSSRIGFWPLVASLGVGAGLTCLIVSQVLFEKRSCLLACGLVFCASVLMRGRFFSCQDDVLLPVRIYFIQIGHWFMAAARNFRVRVEGRGQIGFCLGAVILSIFMVIPNLFMIKDILPTLSFYNARASHIGPLGYFGKEYFLADGGVGSFLYLAFDFLTWRDRWWATYMFLGGSTLFFVLWALFNSSDRRKYIFFFSFLALILLNAHIPRLLNPLHIINAFSNPFSFTNRSFHFTAVAIAPFFLLPLIALGLKDCWERMTGGQGGRRVFAGRMLKFCLVFFSGGLLLCWLNGAEKGLYVYVGKMAGVALIFFVGSFLLTISPRWQKTIFAIGVAGLFLVDALAYAQYFKKILPPDRQVRRSLITQQEEVSDPLLPRNLPVREFFMNYPFLLFRPDAGLMQDRNQGMYYQLVDFDRHRDYVPESDYCFAVPRAYTVLRRNPVYDAYFRQVNRMFLQVPWAIWGDQKELAAIIKGGLTGSIIVLEKPSSMPLEASAGSDRICSSLTDCPIQRPAEKDPLRTLVFPLEKAKPLRENGNLEIYGVSSEGIPSYRTTMMTTADRDRLLAHIGPSLLQPVQGEIFKPFQFDVHNISSNEIIFSVPRGFPKTGQALTVSYPEKLLGGIRDVFVNTNDHLGLVVEAENNGWFLYHSPYGGYWTARVNGQPAVLQKANGAFLALPIHKGLNRIEYEYLSGSRLRVMILLSLIISLGVLFAVFLRFVAWSHAA